MPPKTPDTVEERERAMLAGPGWDTDGFTETVREFAEPLELQPGNIFIGTYINKITVQAERLDAPGEMQDVDQFQFTTVQPGYNSDKTYGLWSSHNVAKGMASVPLGATVKIMYVGKQTIKNGAQTVQEYRIAYKA